MVSLQYLRVNSFEGMIIPGQTSHLLGQLRGDALHLFGKDLVVVLDGLRAYIAARGEHVAVFLNLFQLHRPAESGHVFIRAFGLSILPPAVGGVGNQGNVGIGEDAMHDFLVLERCLFPPSGNSRLLQAANIQIHLPRVQSDYTPRGATRKDRTA